MYQEAKFSRFMFHIRFSQPEDYLNEHELYEIMRSRDLYQSQFALRLNFKKIKRNIAKDEKQTRYGFENSRKLFVRKMQERLENADKLKNLISDKVQRFIPVEKGKETKRKQNKFISQEKSGLLSLPYIKNNNKPISFAADQKQAMPSFGTTIKVPHIRATSAMATVCTSDDGHKLGLSSSKTIRPNTESVINKSVFGERNEVQYKRDNVPVVIFTTEYGQNKNVDYQPDGAISIVAKSNYSPCQTKFNSKSMSNRKSHITFSPAVENIRGEDKAKEWAVKHYMHSKGNDEIAVEQHLDRLLVDRPSKWGLNHCHAGGRIDKSNQNDIPNVASTYKHSKTRKVRGQSDFILPTIEIAPKPMVTLEPGGTTPDGRLVLTKADYEEYLSDYRNARIVRLDTSRKKDEVLGKKIDTFRIEPRLCLRDETSLETSLRSI
ncbi:hypothetical protein ACF0H5_008812 [Mactra antiquata]